MAAGKKGLFKVWYDELVEVYGKEQVLKLLVKSGSACAVGAAVGLVLLMRGLTTMTPLPPQPVQEVNKTKK